MKDHRSLQKSLKILNEKRQTDKSTEHFKVIIHTKAEFDAIEEEMNTMIEQGFFPYNDIPLLQLLTDERYNQIPPPGTHRPDRDGPSVFD